MDLPIVDEKQQGMSTAQRLPKYDDCWGQRFFFFFLLSKIQRLCERVYGEGFC